MDYQVPMIEGAIGVNISALLPYVNTGHLKAMLKVPEDVQSLNTSEEYPAQERHLWTHSLSYITW